MKVSSFAISTVLVASTSFAGGSAPVPRWAAEFAVASINVERNATDGDTEVVISVVPGDEGSISDLARTEQENHFRKLQP